MTGLLSAPRALLDSSATRWYLVFSSAAERHWWDRVFRTRPGFEHVYALRWDGWNWLLYNPHTAFTDVQIVAATDEAALWQLVPADATVLEVEAFRAQDTVRGRWWVGPMTCVEQVKALLGVPVGTIFTPWQLYRFLLEGSHGQAHGTDPAPDPLDEAHARRRVDHGRPDPERRGKGQRPLGEGQPRRRGHASRFIVRRCDRPAP